MSRTRRKHESDSKRDKRGPKNKTEDVLPKGVRKPAAQSRRTEKQNLRRDWL